jgi:exosome complex exonuclease DIS3/RRP44
MLRAKKFAKKTRKGAIVTENQEHYLRDDIACGLQGAGERPATAEARPVHLCSHG